MVGSVAAVVLLVGAVALDRQRTDTPAVEVIFGDDNGLPDTLAEGGNYVAAFDIEWTGPVSMRGGQVSVFKSRTGPTSEDAPEESWPIVCTSEFDDVIFRQRVSCPFQAPGPGEFALLLQVRDALDEVGYRGPVCIESFTADNASIATAASIWRPLARSQDAIATDGLAFLRRLWA
jgi:hypothetical protein